MGIYFNEMVRRDGADFVPTAIKKCQALLDAIAPYSAETEAGKLGMTASLDGGFRKKSCSVLTCLSAAWECTSMLP